jgi:6-phosphogluconolactonase
MHWVQIDAATGMITIGGSETSNGNPVYTSVDATGRMMLGVNHGRGTTDAFPLDPATGAIAGPPVNYRTGANSHSAVFHPANGHVYIASVADSMISQYSFAGGTLTPLNPPSLARPGGPRHFTFHPSGEFAYVSGGPTDMVGMFRVGADGRLTSLGTVTRLPSGLGAEAATHMGSDIHVHPSGRFAYAANRGTNNTLAIYSVGADGRLSLRAHESTRGNTPRTFDIDTAGELLAAGNQDSQTVAVFRVSADTGGLTHLHTEEVTVSPWFVGFFRF